MMAALTSKPSSAKGAKKFGKGQDRRGKGGNFKNKNTSEHKKKGSDAGFSGGKRKRDNKSFDKKDGKNDLNKRQQKKARQAGRPHNDKVMSAKEIWNKLRQKNCDKATRAKHVDNLVNLLRGVMFEVTMKHDAARVVQAIVQFGTPRQRSEVLQELREHMLDLCKSQYGHFVVTKMIRYGSTEDRKRIAKAMEGDMTKLSTHNVAANVVEYAQQWFKPSLFSALRLEFYGREFALIAPDCDKNLGAIAKKFPKKRAEIMKHVAGLLQKMVDKQLLGLAFVQQLAWEYCKEIEAMNETTEEDGKSETSGKDGSAEMVAALRDGALALVSTRHGAKVVAHCAAYGSPKDRKKLLKCFKGKVMDACNHPSGYLALIRLLDVVDDTVSVQKMLLSEMTPHLLDIAEHETGRKVLLHLLAPRAPRYFDPDELSVVSEARIRNSCGDLVSTSKKDPETRRQELLKGLRAGLEAMCIKNMSRLLCSSFGRDVLVEVARVWESETVIDGIAATIEGKECAPDATTEESNENEEAETDEDEDSEEDEMEIEEEGNKGDEEAKADLLEAGDDSGDEEQETSGASSSATVEKQWPVGKELLEDKNAHLALKKLIKASAKCAERLVLSAQNEIREWASSNRGCFVLVALIEETESKALKSKVKDIRADLQNRASKEAGAKVLLQKL